MLNGKTIFIVKFPTNKKFTGILDVMCNQNAIDLKCNYANSDFPDYEKYNEINSLLVQANDSLLTILLNSWAYSKTLESSIILNDY